MASTRNNNSDKSLVDSQDPLVAMIRDQQLLQQLQQDQLLMEFTLKRLVEDSRRKKRGKSQKKNTSIESKIAKLKNSSHSSKLLRKEKDAFFNDDEDYRPGNAIASASSPLMMRAAPISAGSGGVKRKSAATSTSTRTRTNSIRTKKATDTTGTSLSSSILLGTTTRAATSLTPSRNSRTREALRQSDSRDFAKALAGGVDDDNDKNTFLSKRSIILNQGLKLMKEKGGSGSVNGDGVDNDIPQRRSSSIVSRGKKAGNRRKPNRDITSLLQESPRNTSDNIQYGGTNNWNPLNGSRCSDQQNTCSSSARVNSTGGRATYGTLSSSLSQESTNRTNRTRSARRKANHDTEFLSQESPRNTSRYRRDSTTPETIDITNSDSDNDDDIVMEDNQIVEFTLKRLAINNRVRNQEDYQPMIKCDFESNTMLLSFGKSKVNKTNGRFEILIGMGDVQEMSYFKMKDAAGQNNIDLDLDSFIHLRAEAKRRSPDAKSRTKEYNFELEFEEDEHLRDLIQAAEDSGILTPIQTQPEDIKINAKVLIEDSRKKLGLGSQATTQTTQSKNKDSTPTVSNTSSVSTPNTKSQNSSISLFNLKKASNRGSCSERAKIVPGQVIKNSNGPKVSGKEVLDLREEIKDSREEIKRLEESEKRAKEESKRLKESEKMAKEEFKRAQDILLQAGAIIVDKSNNSDNHPKEGTKATTRSLLVVQELRNKNEGLEGRVKNFEEGINKAKKVLEQAWAIVI